METKAQTGEQAPKTDSKTVKLSGTNRTAVIREFLGKDIREAQKIADGDSSKIMFAIIAVTTTIDGQPVTMEEVDEMNGYDVMDLMGAFGSNFTPRQSK
jgi:tryptophanase